LGAPVRPKEGVVHVNMRQRTRRPPSKPRKKAKPPRHAVKGVRPLISSRALAARVKALGRAISRDYRGRSLTLVCVLKGAAVFFADLARAIEVPVELEFIGVSSYANSTQTSGEVRISTDVSRPLAGKDVLLVEDIVDTGLTADFLVGLLQARNPKSVALCTLLEKPSRARTRVEIAYRGFVIPDVFVVGYGLDFAERWRNLPYLGVVRSAPKGA
jgi:hypoxanthine phosphoribosyltransferase